MYNKILSFFFSDKLFCVGTFYLKYQGFPNFLSLGPLKSNKIAKALSDKNTQKTSPKYPLLFVNH